MNREEYDTFFGGRESDLGNGCRWVKSGFVISLSRRMQSRKNALDIAFDVTGMFPRQTSVV